MRKSEGQKIQEKEIVKQKFEKECLQSEIEGTKINYPIVQGEENSYYLKHLFSGEWNGSGCIFLDFRNDASFADRHSIIYGHHMKNGTMFTDLDKYKKQEFFDEHPIALLITPDKNTIK